MSKKTKEVQCIICNEQMTVSLFMSPLKAKCESCKKSDKRPAREILADKPTQEISPTPPAKVVEGVAGDDAFFEVPIDPMKTSASLPTIEHILDVPMEKNQSLRKLCCPHHTDTQMEVTAVVRSDLYGDVLSMQCPVCFTIVQITEPNQFPNRKYVKLRDKFAKRDKELQAKGVLEGLYDEHINERYTIEEEIAWIKQIRKL